MNKTIIISIFAIILLVTSVVAAPGVPHQFYGSVTVNGNTAPDNLFIEARIGTNSYTTITKNGQYGYNAIFYVEDPNNNRQGNTIQFFIEGVLATQYTFDNGQSTNLDLSASGVTIPNTGSGGASSGSGGSGTSSTNGGTNTGASNSGGSGGAIISSNDATSTTNNLSNELNNLNNANESCEPIWVCSEWTECTNNQQRRVCVDRNECGLEETKPDERRSCDMTEQEVFGAAPGESAPRQGFFNSITSFVTGTGDAVSSWASLALVGVILAGLLILLFFRKKKNK